MASIHDGPRSPHFFPIRHNAGFWVGELGKADLSPQAKEHCAVAPSGSCTGWGIPFEVGNVLLLRTKLISIKVAPFSAPWLVFMHCTDYEPLPWNQDGLLSPTRGEGRLGEPVADYVLCYEDGAEARFRILRRHHIGMCVHRWGENCFQAVPHHKFFPTRPPHEQQPPAVEGMMWGPAQTRVCGAFIYPWRNYLWACENPHPKKTITSFRFEPLAGTVLISAIAVGDVTQNPLVWQTRRKAVFTLPDGVSFDPWVDEHGLLRQIQLDLGQVISAQPRREYPNRTWGYSYNNQTPAISAREILIEYAAHPNACFHLYDDTCVPVAEVESRRASEPLTPIPAATQRVRLRVLDKASNKPVPVKLHVHGAAGEYLAPVDRHRIPNPAWYEDYSVDFLNQNIHCCTYIDGDTSLDLPLGPVHIEVSKGFEIKPIRKVLNVTRSTRTVTLKLDKVLDWRGRGWVTADTHVHFLSPSSARLEGSAEGVNVVNLLASQWGELMTNVGDFDGKTTFGSKEAGGDGEWLVRVGTENRQFVLGHISLLGYSGNIIAPMTTGGPEEAALGDPVGALLTEWARQCRKQGGLVVVPHFPNPRAEHAATIVDGSIDAVEMTSWGSLYAGIDPYSLSDWYRYLNCGYMLPAVGGTDKMSANTAVGTVRTYAHIPKNRPFTYANWMKSVRSGNTFVTYGPLLEFAVEGKPAGAHIAMSRRGGTVDVTWTAASVTIPMTRIDLVVNGAIRESQPLAPWNDQGHWSIKIDSSSWIAILVRGHYPDQPEIVAAHSSPVMVNVEGTQVFAAADAVTILDQIEGALAYLDTTGTRAQTARYKRMRLTLTAAYRKLHNRLHHLGHNHAHTPVTDHKEHR